MMLDSAAHNLVPDNDAGFEPSCHFVTEIIKMISGIILSMVE